MQDPAPECPVSQGISDHLTLVSPSAGSYLGMTVPIVTVVRTDEAQAVLSRAVTVAYYLPPEFQGQPPQPFDGDIIIDQWPATIIYARSL